MTAARRPRTLVVAVTGASGSVYARRLLDVLDAGGHTVHLSVSHAGAIVLRRELGIALDLDAPRLDDLLGRPLPHVTYHADADLTAPIASGSFPIDGMIICPCSAGTLGAIAAGLGSTLIERVADVALKERRPLILALRETPLSLIHIENMAKVTRAGATVLPAAPAFYHGPEDIDGLVDFIVARILDQVGIAHGLATRWEADPDRP